MSNNVVILLAVIVLICTSLSTLLMRMFTVTEAVSSQFLSNGCFVQLSAIVEPNDSDLNTFVYVFCVVILVDLSSSRECGVQRTLSSFNESVRRSPHEG